MSIKLRKLLNLTEQAPQPPMGGPVAAPVAPPAGMDAGLPATPEAPAPEAPTPDTAPEPENPAEYDFTRDFRAFEDKKNKAEADAKKVLLDKMNKRLLNKTIVANASRGYGQPKTDYTIENVKKISVEFWYKDYVVIATDANDKKYFLTPGINIKIESEGSEPAPGAEPEAPKGEEQPPTQGQAPGGEEAPNLPQGPEGAAGGPPAGAPPAPQGEPNAQTGQPPAGEDGQPAAGAEKPAPQQSPQAAPQAPAPVAPEDPRKKKKKLPPVAEWIQSDLNTFLTEFMSDDVKDEYGNVNYIQYLKEAKKVLAEGVNADKVRCKLVIPENHMIGHVQNRDIKLAAIDSMRKKTYYGQYSKGSVDINKQGRYYLLEYVKEVGWNI